jgi:hypothetical protein
MFEIGSSLREARVRKGLEIADAERATRIRGKYLRALETETFEVLPNRAYIRVPAGIRGLPRPRRRLFVDSTSRFWVDEISAARSRRIRVRGITGARTSMVLLTIIGIGVVTALVIAAGTSAGVRHRTRRSPTSQRRPSPRRRTRPSSRSKRSTARRCRGA